VVDRGSRAIDSIVFAELGGGSRRKLKDANPNRAGFETGRALAFLAQMKIWQVSNEKIGSPKKWQVRAKNRKKKKKPKKMKKGKKNRKNRNWYKSGTMYQFCTSFFFFVSCTSFVPVLGDGSLYTRKTHYKFGGGAKLVQNWYKLVQDKKKKKTGTKLVHCTTFVPISVFSVFFSFFAFFRFFRFSARELGALLGGLLGVSPYRGSQCATVFLHKSLTLRELRVARVVGTQARGKSTSAAPTDGDDRTHDSLRDVWGRGLRPKII